MPERWKVAAKCPRCKSRDFMLAHIYEEAEEWSVRGGVISAECNRLSLDQVRSYCICDKCDHEWRPRAKSIEEQSVEKTA